MSTVNHDVEVVLDAGAVLGESPIWDDRSGTLVWVDIVRGEVHRLDPNTGVDVSYSAGKPVGAALPHRLGGLILAAADGLWHLDDDGNLSERVRLDPGRVPSRVNDAKCDPAGRIWAGTIALDLQSGAGRLLQFGEDREVTVLLDGLTVPNGLGWSPDGTAFYLIDSFGYSVEVYDTDAGTGALHHRGSLVELPAEQGLGDGLVVDSDGCVWVALFGGSALQRFTPTGQPDVRIELPVSQVTSAAFGGSNYDVLFITTARSDENGPMAPERLVDQPLAGAVFAVHAGIHGFPTTTAIC